jgi:lysozyme
MAPINLKVLDLSHHNTVSSFDAIRKHGIVGVILKATQGRGMVDKTYADRVKAARAAGLLTGAYHFNTGENIAQQVEHFIETVKPDDHTLMALDWEDNRPSNMSVAQAHEFLERVDAKLGRKAKLYSGNRVKDLLGQHIDPFLGEHHLWLAQYGNAPRPQASWSRVWLWQYSDGVIGPRPHFVSGVSGQVDCNSFDGDDDQITKEWAS